LFTGNARMMRPVFNLELEQIELIGTFEQVYLDISISEDEIRPNVCKTHAILKLKTVFKYNIYCSHNLDNFI